MKIVILGWGSLIWNPNGLPVIGDWQRGGPVLPIEFSRISKDGRLTLVIDEANGTDVITRYALSSRSQLKDALEDLRMREDTVQACIGFVDLIKSTMNPPPSSMTNRIWEWAENTGVEAVVWTALTSNFHEKTGAPFSVEKAMAYLNSLRGAERDLAFDYIRNAPEEANTPLCHRFGTLQGYKKVSRAIPHRS